MSGNGLKIALAVSLAVNLFVLGAVAGVAGAQWGKEPRRGPPQQQGQGPGGGPQGGGNPLMAAGDRLPPEVRENYRSKLREQGQASQPQLTAARQARQEASSLLAVGDYDGAKTKLQQARAAELEARAALEAAVIEFAKTAEPPERRILAQALRRGPEGRGPGRGGPGRGGRDGMGRGPGGFDGARPDGLPFGPGPEGAAEPQ